MNAAISYLKIQLEMLESLEKINRAQGRVAQAELEATSAKEILAAIELLSAAH